MTKIVGVIGSKGFVGSSIYRYIKLKKISINRNNYLDLQKKKFDIVINCAMPSKRFWAKQNPKLDFKEYLLVVNGSGTLVTRADAKGPKTESFVHLSKGTCTKTEENIYHTVYAITEMTIVAMLTKRLDDCYPPIVRVDD